MATSTLHRPRWLAVARSATLAWLQLTALTVAALYALFGGVPLVAALTGSTLATALSGALLSVAGLEFILPGTVAAAADAARRRMLAGVPVAAALVGLAAFVAVRQPAGVDLLGDLAAFLVMAGVMMALAVVVAVARRDAFLIPAYRR